MNGYVETFQLFVTNTIGHPHITKNAQVETLFRHLIFTNALPLSHVIVLVNLALAIDN